MVIPFKVYQLGLCGREKEEESREEDLETVSGVLAKDRRPAREELRAASGRVENSGSRRVVHPVTRGCTDRDGL